MTAGAASSVDNHVEFDPRRLLLLLHTWLLFLIHRVALLWSRPHKQGHVRDIPGPVALPYFGSLRPRLQDVQVQPYCAELFDKYGPIVKFEYLRNFPVIFLLDAEDCKKVLKECTLDLRPPMEHMVAYRTSRPDHYDNVGLVNANGVEWEKLYKNVAKISLSHQNIATLNEGVNEIASDFIASAEDSGRVIDLLDYCSRFSVECSFHTIFNMRMGLFDVTKAEESRALMDFLGTYFRSFHLTLSEIPFLRYFQKGAVEKYASLEEKMLKLVEKLVRECMESGGGSVLFKQIFGVNMSYKSQRLTVVEFLNGATDPVLNQLVFILYEICRNERVEAKLLEELKSLMPTKDTFIYDADRAKLPYLKACISETMRLSPSAPNVARVTNESMEIQGYTLPPYTVVIAQTLFAALSPDMFYKPKEFLPERWLGGNDNAQFHPHRTDVLFPFGSSRRACPGRRLFMSVATIIIARLLRKFKVTFHKEIESNFDFLRVVKSPVHVSLEERPE